MAAPVLVLVYYRIALPASGAATVTTHAFEQQMDWLAAHADNVVPLHKVVQWHDMAAPAVAITVDDGHDLVLTQL